MGSTKVITAFPIPGLTGAGPVELARLGRVRRAGVIQVTHCNPQRVVP